MDYLPLITLHSLTEVDIQRVERHLNPLNDAAANHVLAQYCLDYLRRLYPEYGNQAFRVASQDIETFVAFVNEHEGAFVEVSGIVIGKDKLADSLTIYARQGVLQHYDLGDVIEVLDDLLEELAQHGETGSDMLFELVGTIESVPHEVRGLRAQD